MSAPYVVFWGKVVLNAAWGKSIPIGEIWYTVC